MKAVRILKSGWAYLGKGLSPKGKRRCLTLPAPAKWNRKLRILGKTEEASGYHRIRTQLQFLDWGDTLTFIPLGRPGGVELDLELAPWVTGIEVRENLVLRAAEALQARYPGQHPGFRVVLRKQIPARKGLGGGSSNAATTLWALNALWGCGATRKVLADLGATLGCDVPFFVHGHACEAHHWGEHLTFQRFPQRGMALMWTEEESLTKEAYQRFDDLFEGKPAERTGASNDFEHILRFFPKTSETGRILEAHGWKKFLSGSGTAGLTPCTTLRQQSRLSVLLQTTPITHYLFVRTCNLSPLRHIQLLSTSSRAA